MTVEDRAKAGCIGWESNSFCSEKSAQCLWPFHPECLHFHLKISLPFSSGRFLMSWNLVCGLSQLSLSAVLTHLQDAEHKSSLCHFTGMFKYWPRFHVEVELIYFTIIYWVWGWTSHSTWERKRLSVLLSTTWVLEISSVQQIWLQVPVFTEPSCFLWCGF